LSCMQAYSDMLRCASGVRYSNKNSEHTGNKINCHDQPLVVINVLYIVCACVQYILLTTHAGVDYRSMVLPGRSRPKWGGVVTRPVYLQSPSTIRHAFAVSRRLPSAPLCGRRPAGRRRYRPTMMSEAIAKSYRRLDAHIALSRL
jgi:hypothetical protein